MPLQNLINPLQNLANGQYMSIHWIQWKCFRWEQTFQLLGQSCKTELLHPFFQYDIEWDYTPKLTLMPHCTSCKSCSNLLLHKRNAKRSWNSSARDVQGSKVLNKGWHPGLNNIQQLKWVQIVQTRIDSYSMHSTAINKIIKTEPSKAILSTNNCLPGERLRLKKQTENVTHVTQIMLLNELRYSE